MDKVFKEVTGDLREGVLVHMELFKRMKRVTFTVFVFLVACAVSSSAQAEKDEYIFAVKNDLSSSQNVQARKIFGDALGILAQELDINVKMVDYTSDEELLAAMKSQSVDFVFVTTTVFYLGMIDYGYKPFATASMFGSDDTRLCLYATKDSPYESVEDMRGLKAYTYKDQYEYFALYELVGEPPEDFFGSLKISPNGQSMIYALAMGDVDVVFAQSSNILFFNKTNPGAVKNIKEVICSAPYYSNPIMAQKDIPDSLIKKVQDSMDRVLKSDAFKQYKPMLKMFQWKHLRVTLEDYSGKIELFKSAMEKGWEENYKTWLLYAGGND